MYLNASIFNSQNGFIQVSLRSSELTTDWPRACDITGIAMILTACVYQDKVTIARTNREKVTRVRGEEAQRKGA